jgi:RNA polymerase sigma-70 factor (ECF subfamily)
MDATEFELSTESLRHELLAHCYRMLGAVNDAEDAVQETYLRAWRAYGRFDGRSSVRVWLYRIATNACLNTIRRRDRRVLPSGLGRPTENPRAEPVPGGAGVAWLEPIPDTLVTHESEDPATIVATRESIRLALIATLQYLPGRQRAVLILRDVLGFPAPEVAEMLDTTTAAVKSALQRARARLRQAAPVPDDVPALADSEQRALLERYIAAFEAADAAALKRLLRADAILEATPLRTWFAGRSSCMPYLAERVLGSPGDWRMLPSRANGQPAALAYVRKSDGTHAPYGVVLLTATAAGIAGIHAFGDPDLVGRFPHATSREGSAVDLRTRETRHRRWRRRPAPT